MAPARTPPAPTGRRRRLGSFLRREGTRWAELAALCGLAVAQPVLAAFGESPDTFVALDASGADIVWFALVVALGPPIVLGLVGALTSPAGDRTRGWVHVASVGALAGLAAVVVARDGGARGALALVVGVVVVGAAIVAHRRWAAVRTALRYASPAPLAFAALFLVASPVAPLVAGAGAEGGGTAGAGAGDAPPVLVVVFDELPLLTLLDGEGGIDEQLFPNFARLAGTSTWYRDATTVSADTRLAVPSLLTGVVPEDNGRWDPGSGGEHHNLFGLLDETHDVHAHEWITSLCPAGVCRSPDRDAEPVPEVEALLAGDRQERRGTLPTLLGEARDLWWRTVGGRADEQPAEQVVVGIDGAHDLARPALEFLSSMGPVEDEPVLDYYHASVPHQPWHLLPSGRNVTVPHSDVGLDAVARGGGYPTPAWSDDAEGRWRAEESRMQHVLQSQWADRLLGAFLDRMEHLDRWDEAVVVVTADHGISFEPGEMLRVLRPTNQVETAWVPLFVKAPDQDTGEVVDGNVVLVDVLPTIAELVGVTPDWDLDGRSMVGGPTREPGRKPAVSLDPDVFAERDGGDRVWLAPGGLEALLAAVPVTGQPGDDLRVWRLGEHGDLLGRRVDDLGVCDAAGGPTGRLHDLEGWRDGVRADRPDGAIDLWIDGELDDERSHDVVVAVDDTVAGWAPSRVADGGNRFGMLLAEPLVVGATATPALFRVIDGDDCSLAPVPPG